MNKRARAFVIVLLVVCVGFGAFLVTSRKSAETPHVVTQEAPIPEAVESPQTVKVYRVAVEDNEVLLKATESNVDPGEDPMEAALRRMIEQGDSPDLANPIPKGTKVLGIKVDKGTATLDLSREFRDNFTGGSEEEGLTIGAILRTLGQFPEVKRVLFLVEGKPLDTLGHLDLTGPQDVGWVGSDF